MKKIFISILSMLIIILNVQGVSANDTIETPLQYYNDFINSINQVYPPNSNELTPQDKSKYPKILNSLHMLLENYPDDQWTYAAFFYLAESPRFHFDTSISNMAILTKDFKFKNEYSKYIFEYLIKLGSYDEEFPFEKIDEICKNCNDKSYKVYLNSLLMYDYEKPGELRDKIINETLNDYPNSLAYADAANVKILRSSKPEKLKMFLNMISEDFYKDKPWKDAYFSKEGIFQKSFLGIIAAYIYMNDLEKARVYLKIAEEKFPDNNRLKYYQYKIQNQSSNNAKNKKNF